MVFVMFAFWFLTSQAMTYAAIEGVRKALVAVEPRVPLATLALQIFLRLFLLFAIMTIATGATIMLAWGGHLATLPSYVGITFWSACVLCSTVVVSRAFPTPPREFKLISTNPVVLVAGLAASLFVTTVMFPNADAIAAWGRQHPVTFLGLDLMAIIVVLIIVIPPIVVFGFSLHLLVLTWLRLKQAVFPKRGE